MTHLPVAVEEFGTYRNRRFPVTSQAGESPVHVAPVVDASHHLLTRVAPFVETHHPIGEPRFLGEIVQSVVYSVTGQASLDPDRLPCGAGKRTASDALRGFYQGRLELIGSVSRQDLPPTTDALRPARDEDTTGMEVELDEVVGWRRLEILSKKIGQQSSRLRPENPDQSCTLERFDASKSGRQIPAEMFPECLSSRLGKIEQQRPVRRTPLPDLQVGERAPPWRECQTGNQRSGLGSENIVREESVQRLDRPVASDLPGPARQVTVDAHRSRPCVSPSEFVTRAGIQVRPPQRHRNERTKIVGAPARARDRLAAGGRRL